MVDYKKAAMTALGVTGVSYGLGLLYKKFFATGITTITFSAIGDVNVANQIKSGFDTTIAGKLLGYLNGVFPTTGKLGAFLLLFAASFLIVVLGSMIADRISYGKSDTARFAIGMTLAAGLLGLLAGTVSPSIGYLGAGLAMLIYFGIVASVYQAIRQIEGIGSFLPNP